VSLEPFDIIAGDRGELGELCGVEEDDGILRIELASGCMEVDGRWVTK